MAEPDTAGQAPLSIRIAQEGTVPVISVAGEPDATNVSELKSAVEAVLSGHDQRVVFEVVPAAVAWAAARRPRPAVPQQARR